MVLLCIYFEANAHTLPNKTLYAHASVGLARSEDGLKFMIKESASQWTPKANLGIGYQYPLKNRYALIATVEYDWANRQGEVQGVGDKQFRNKNLAFQLELIF